MIGEIVKEPVCNHCGKCCYWNGQKCKNLVLLKSGKTLCRIYYNRLGSKTGTGDAICVNRIDSHKNYPGCPYNREEWND